MTINSKFYLLVEVAINTLKSMGTRMLVFFIVFLATNKKWNTKLIQPL